MILPPKPPNQTLSDYLATWGINALIASHCEAVELLNSQRLLCADLQQRMERLEHQWDELLRSLDTGAQPGEIVAELGHGWRIERRRMTISSGTRD